MLTRREIFSYGARVCPKERLLSKYEVSESGCWEYTGGKDPYGYGRFRVGPRQLGAHKVSYVLHKGDVPEGRVVMHRCDNPACINPEHLRLGTVRDNIHDCIGKGRFPMQNLLKGRDAAIARSGISSGCYKQPITRVERNPLLRRRMIIAWNDVEMLVFTDVYALMKAGFHDGSVSSCANGKSRSYRGYQWRYENRGQLAA